MLNGWSPYKDAKEYIEKNIEIDSNGCWNWKLRLNHGYGEIHTTGWARLYKVTRAHQLSYKVFKGDYRQGLCILHKCNNPSCVNPGHLRAGTHKENMKDMFNAGRQHDRTGENGGNSKLTWNIVRYIRYLIDNKIVMQKDIAKFYGVRDTAITKIKNRTRWVEPKCQIK